MVVFQGSIHNNIQVTKGVHIHNNIHTHSDIQILIFTEVLHKIFNLISKLIPSGNVKLIQGFPIPQKEETWWKGWILKGIPNGIIYFNASAS